MIRRLFCFIVFTSLFSIQCFAASTSTINTLLRDPNTPHAGNAKGSITIVEFFDYQCSHCISMAPVVNSIINENPDVKFVFKDLPFSGPQSEFAARAALAANYQGKYYDFSHALLMTNLPLSKDLVLEIARTVGLNVPKLQKEMASNNLTKQISGNFQLAKDLRIAATPSFYIAKSNATSMDNITFYQGEMSLGEMQAAINKAKS